MIRGSIPFKGKKVSVHLSSQTASGAHPAPYRMGSVLLTHLCIHGMYVYMYVWIGQGLKLTTYLRLVPTYPSEELHFCSSHRTPLPLSLAQRSQTARCSEHDRTNSCTAPVKSKTFPIVTPNIFVQFAACSSLRKQKFFFKYENKWYTFRRMCYNCLMWVWHVVSHSKLRTQAEGVRE